MSPLEGELKKKFDKRQQRPRGIDPGPPGNLCKTYGRSRSQKKSSPSSSSNSLKQQRKKKKCRAQGPTKPRAKKEQAVEAGHHTKLMQLSLRSTSDNLQGVQRPGFVQLTSPAPNSDYAIISGPQSAVTQYQYPQSASTSFSEADMAGTNSPHIATNFQPPSQFGPGFATPGPGAGMNQPAPQLHWSQAVDHASFNPTETFGALQSQPFVQRAMPLARPPCNTLPHQLTLGYGMGNEFTQNHSYDYQQMGDELWHNGKDGASIR